MTIVYSLLAFSLVIGVLNLFATIFLSNALYRVLAPPDNSRKPPPDRSEKGLVDLKQAMTYDPRFASEK